MQAPDEPTLIQRSQSGDVSAFNVLVETYQDQVYSVVLRMVRNHATAEDIAQEAFISAFRHIRRFRGGSFRAWLVRIARNAAYDVLRREQRRPATSIDEDIVTFETRLVSSEATPEESALTAELGAHIAQALGALPPEQRMAVVLVDVEGFRYEEAATAMEVSVGTVKSRLSRARARLRERLLAAPELLPSQFRHKSEGGGN